MAILSPRSADYQRLEGGLGPGRMGPRGPHRAGTLSWKKLALGVVFVVGLVWFVMPSGKTGAALGMGGGKSKEQWYHDDEADTEPFVPAPPTTKGTHPNTAADASATNGATPSASSHDSKYPSFETDPDPTKTPHCTHPHTPSARLVQYALMIDAGSTGSRIHVYKFNNCGTSPAYEYEVFKLTKPGLSDYAGRPDDAARSLDVLMDEAVRVVPAHLRSCTPVAVKATAGLRRLDGSKSTDILKAVEHRLREKYPFPLPEKGAVEIMEGKDEGVFAWITANYLLDTIRPEEEVDDGSKKTKEAESGTGNSTTYAVLDLGGASTQIVFEPFFSKPDASLIEGEHKYELAFGGRTHTLYQHSYLDYGLSRARQHVHQLVDFLATIRGSSGSSSGGGRADVGDVLVNPCLARGMRKIVGVEDDKAGVVRNVTMDGQDVGSFEACSRLVQLVMAKDAICETKPCAFNGVYQPSLLETFASGKVMLLSYFYDRLFELLDPASYASLRISTIASLAQDVCAGREAWSERWGAQPDVIKELEGRPEWCLDLTFMYTLLRLGYEFEDDRVVGIGKRMRNTELGWCLGATLAMVGGELTCKV